MLYQVHLPKLCMALTTGDILLYRAHIPKLYMALSTGGNQCLTD